MTQTQRDQLIQGLLQLASAIERREPNRAIVAVLQANQIHCHGAIAEQAGPRQELLRHFIQALDTWAKVWPQMGAREEFRAAVAREARQWAARLK